MSLLAPLAEPAAAPDSGRRHRERSAFLAVLLASIMVAVLGGVWLLRPELNFYAQPSNAWLPVLIGAGATAAVQTILGLLGVAAALAALAGALPRPARTAVGLVEILGFGIALQGFTTLSTVGYLVAMAMPVIVVVVLVQVLRRYRVARWAVGLPGLAALAAGGVTYHSAILHDVVLLTGALADQAVTLVIGLVRLATAVGWAWWSITAVQGTPQLRRMTAWVTAHRRGFTLLAACGPLPYALIRLTWLTPWPAFAPDGLDLSVRLWGLTLSSGAWLGVVLTIGLIRPWGERFPRWMPIVAGRPVPVLAAAVPGGVVAAAMTFVAVPVLIVMPQVAAAVGQLLGPVEVIEAVVVFPCWLWGPSLALAVWGYVGHRRDTASAKMVR